MKKWLIIFLFFFLIGCDKTAVHVYEDGDIAAFDEVCENIGDGHTKAYDLRVEPDCIAGRIPGFFCMRTVNSEDVIQPLDAIYENLKILIGKDYGYLIIFMDEDGTDAGYLAEKLAADGYDNIHYFKGGYDRYAELAGEDFVPETGECDAC